MISILITVAVFNELNPLTPSLRLILPPSILPVTTVSRPIVEKISLLKVYFLINQIIYYLMP